MLWVTKSSTQPPDSCNYQSTERVIQKNRVSNFITICLKRLKISTWNKESWSEVDLDCMYISGVASGRNTISTSCWSKQGISSQLVTRLSHQNGSHHIHRSKQAQVRKSIRGADNAITKLFQFCKGISKVLLNNLYSRMKTLHLNYQSFSRTDTYQYSYAYQNFIMSTPGGIAPPSILFRYDVAPMEVSLWNLLQLLVCATFASLNLSNIVDHIYIW